MKIGTKTALLMTALAAVHIAVLFAGFVSPYDIAQQNRDFPYAPPTHFHFGAAHGIHLRPLVCAYERRGDADDEYLENRGRCYPIHFFVHGWQYDLFGFRSSLHLFGADAPANIFLMGSDGYGRDVFSRFLYGGRVSLFAGLLATVLTLFLGTLLGAVAGFYGGWFDSLVMRCAELFLALPWLYLLFALRAFLPLSLSSLQAFMLLIAVIGVVSWPRPARLIRGIVLSARERHYVFAASLFGASDLYLIRRHILPDTYSIIITQAAMLIPQYVLAEVMLSFLGLGMGEPVPSWGNMLSALQQYAVLVSYWWMLIPGLAMIPVFFAYSFLASDLLLRAADRT